EIGPEGHARAEGPFLVRADHRRLDVREMEDADGSRVELARRVVDEMPAYAQHSRLDAVRIDVDREQAGGREGQSRRAQPLSRPVMAKGQGGAEEDRLSEQRLTHQTTGDLTHPQVAEVPDVGDRR